MRVSSGGAYGGASERRFSAESLARLERHELFDFQIAHAGVSARVAELQELLQRGRDEPDLAELLDELVHELEDEIFDAGENVTFLLATLQHFRQQMELFLELDQEAGLAASAVVKNIFAPPKTSSKKSATPVSPARRTSESVAQPRRSPGRKPPHAPSKPDDQPVVKPQPVKPQHATSRDDDDDMVCGVCLQPDSLDHDPIVICDLCGVAVHQSCYRIEDLPDDDWFCRPCAKYLDAKDVGGNVTPTFELYCEACKEKGGAFIATVDDTWVHMACSMFLPELYVQASHRHNGEEVIGGIEQLGERRKLRCCYCKKKDRGACAQCVVGKCTTSYHVLCALKHNIKFMFMEDKSQFGSGCARHQKQFCGEEHQPVATTDEEAPKRKVAKPQETVAPASPHARVGAKGKKKLPRRRDSLTSESSDGDDGIVLDEESDNSSMFSSDIDSDVNSPARRKSPARGAKSSPAKPAAASPRPQRVSPAKVKSPGRGRPPKKQQTLMVPSFGIVKQLAKPNLTKPVGPAPPAPKPATAPTAPLLPVPMAPAQAPSRPPGQPQLQLTTMHTKTQLFVPISETVLETGVFEDVLLVIPTMPLGISVRTEDRPNGKLMLLQAQQLHTNMVVIDALRRGILQDGDEVVTVNDVSLRKRDTISLKPVLMSLAPPFRIWLKLKSKRKLASFTTAPAVAATTPAPSVKPFFPVKPATPAKPITPVVPERKAQPVPVPTEPTVEEPKPPKAPEVSANRTPMEEALSTDWPWFYLRSDGKLAMNLMWKSLEAGFFVQKFDRKTWEQLVGKVEALIGFRLNSAHPEYSQTTEDLLYFPSREHPVPKYIQDYRESQKQKKSYLASDSVFVGVNLEQLNQDDEWDDMPALAVGTTVQVAKRTWPGINKLGGAGRVRKVHEETSADGSKKRYVYDIAYILGGSEKKVERKWIQAVVDLKGENPETTPTKQQPEATPDKSEATPPKEPETENVQLRFGLRVEVADKDAELPPVTRSTEKKVQLQVSVLQNSVSMQKGSEREMLWHVHFPVKQKAADALLSDALAGGLEYVVDRGDDADESDAEDEESEVTKQLLAAQAQFKYVMERNEALFSALKLAVEQEYGSKQYRKRKLDDIQAKHYDAMYRDMAAARKEFDDSDESSDDEAGASGGVPRVSRDQSTPGTRARGDSSGGSDSESDQDDSCGGMFINKIKQEGNEVCVLCELTGGDFAATSNGGFVHPQCAMYTPETFFKDGVAHGLDQIPAAERRALACQICGGKKGLSKIQCASQRCLTAYHVSCAYVNGLLTRDPHYQAWCPKHLKTSGMQNEIEWPPHMKPKHQTPAKSPQRGAKTGDAISSSKSNSKRKRRRSGTTQDATEDSAGRKKPTAVIDVDNDNADDALADRNLARRLVIDEDSDEGFDPSVVFKKGDFVTVRARDGPNVNKPGGVARVTQVNEAADGQTVTYDVAYVLDNAKEKQVPAKYVRVYVSDEPDSASHKKRSRGA